MQREYSQLVTELCPALHLTSKLISTAVFFFFIRSTITILYVGTCSANANLAELYGHYKVKFGIFFLLYV